MTNQKPYRKSDDPFSDLILPGSVVEQALEAVRQNFSLTVSGSPLSELIFLLTDLLSKIRQSIKKNIVPKVNQGIKFDSEEQLLEEENELFDLPIVESALKYQGRVPRSYDEPFFDPVSQHQYHRTVDPLGNPRQMAVEYESQAMFTTPDSRRIARVLQTIEQFLSFLALGRIQWKFIHSLEKMVKKPSTPLKNIPFHYFNRKRKKRARNNKS